MTEASLLNFRYLENPLLPKLAWCALIRANSGTIAVHHGVGVETHAGYFVEGAWDGSFSEGRFDQAVTFTGTGARLMGDRVRFSSATHNLERCYTLEKEQTLFISNSLAFLLVMSEETLDPSHPTYYFDFLRWYRVGLRHRHHAIKTQTGRKAWFHDCRNFDVNKGRITDRRLRDFGYPPQSFEDYHHWLLITAERVFGNASDPARRTRYKPLASISKGYDSPATAAVSAACGCEEAFTFNRSLVTSDSSYADDNGAEIARLLGMRCAEYDRIDLCDAPVELLQLHFQNPFGSIVSSMDQASELLSGRVFVTGRHGEHFWNMDPVRSLPGYQEPTQRKTLVQNTLEFRLDRGYIDLHLPYTGGVYAPQLLKIGRSAEMRPYRVGGDYDRPIPRRIVESAGIPRHEFGRHKMGGAEAGHKLCTFSDVAEADFRQFYSGYVPDPIKARQHENPRGGFGYYEHGGIRGLDRWLRSRYGLRTISEYLLGFRNHQRRFSPYLYTFHWGFGHVADRYRRAVADMIEQK